jgi:hypothetical protein
MMPDIGGGEEVTAPKSFDVRSAMVYVLPRGKTPEEFMQNHEAGSVDYLALAIRGNSSLVYYNGTCFSGCRVQGSKTVHCIGEIQSDGTRSAISYPGQKFTLVYRTEQDGGSEIFSRYEKIHRYDGHGGTRKEQQAAHLRKLRGEGIRVKDGGLLFESVSRPDLSMSFSENSIFNFSDEIFEVHTIDGSGVPRLAACSFAYFLIHEIAVARTVDSQRSAMEARERARAELVREYGENWVRNHQREVAQRAEQIENESHT